MHGVPSAEERTSLHSFIIRNMCHDSVELPEELSTSSVLCLFKHRNYAILILVRERNGFATYCDTPEVYAAKSSLKTAKGCEVCASVGIVLVIRGEALINKPGGSHSVIAKLILEHNTAILCVEEAHGLGKIILQADKFHGVWLQCVVVPALSVLW